MWEGIFAIVLILKPILVPLATLIAGWLMPSPFQKAAKGQADTHAAEKKADETRGDVSDLDNLP